MKLALVCIISILAVNFSLGKAWADDKQENRANIDLTNSTTSIPATTSSAIVTPSPTSKPTQKPSKPTAKASVLDCPVFCDCQDTRIFCKDNYKFKVLPNLSKFLSVTEITFRNTTVEQLDFSLLPPNIERLDLARNNISSINNGKVIMSKLKQLDLSENQIKNMTTLFPPAVKFPIIEELVLSSNPITDIFSSGVFNSTKSLETLKIDKTKLKTIHESAFNYLTELKYLTMSSLRLANHLGLRTFANNRELKFIDLSNNSLIEVPFALRSTSSIETLILDGNLLTSLRSSDFINQTSLQQLHVKNCPNLTKIDEFTFSNLPMLHSLYLSNNPKLSSISKDAFKSESLRDIYNLDLSGDNFTTLFDPAEFQSVHLIQRLILNNNPWNCNCDLEWFKKLDIKSQVHCKSPELYKDMEIGYFLTTIDCEQEKSSYHKIILATFLLFLLGLTVAVFVQKSDLCRRLFWKDQYGTIYYTKASFQPEAV